MNNNCIFQRVEKKYLLSDMKFKLLMKLIKPYITADKYGLHTICNIYYDTDTYTLIRNSIEKPIYKEKLRLRSYGVPMKDDKVFLELKKKYKSTVFKRRIQLTLEEADAYIENGVKPRESNQIFKEIDYFVNLYKLEKKVFIAYDRIAYFGNEDINLRVTFDMNIRSRLYDLNLSSGDYGNKIDNHANCLMEIKTSGAMPLWLVKILSELEIYPSPFSKYGFVYKQNLSQSLNALTYKGRNMKCLQVS